MVQIIYVDKRQQIVIVILVHHQQSVAHHMQSHRELVLSALYCFHYILINDFHNSSKRFEIHLFVDDANLFYKHESLQQLQENINAELINIQTWLCANKLSLNIEKSNFTPFHPLQKMSQDSSLNLN